MNDRNDPHLAQPPAPDIADGQADKAARSPRFQPFPGHPRFYRRIAIFGSLGVHLYLLAGFYIVKNFLAGEAWPTTWVPIAVGFASMLLFAHFSYRWIMRLDAQYGKGSSWILEPTMVKLPRQRQDP